MTTGKTNDKVERPSQGKCTRESMAKVHTDIRRALMEGQRRMMEAVTKDNPLTKLIL
jgi:hypothetical protein